MDHMVQSPGILTPTSPMGNSSQVSLGVPPKLKGRRRILQSLQRMSSSPSLAKMGRTRASTYSSGSRAAMSCVSLSSSTSSYGQAYGNSYSSQSGGFSTAPTSVPNTPGTEMPFFDSKVRIRFLSREHGSSGTVTPTTVPLPAEFRVGSKGIPLGVTPEITEVFEDYFTRPATRPNTSPRRRKIDFWGEMPDEIKVEIFRYLKPKEIVKCSAVSRRWHQMCFDGQLWTSLDASEFYRDIPSESLVKIMTDAGPFVKDLNLRGCVQLRERWLSDSQKITDVCRNLENFSIEDCKIDRTSVHYFLLRNPRLVHINLTKSAALNNSAMKIIASTCPQLEHLNVSWCQHIDTKGLQKIVQSCTKLKDLRAVEIPGWNEKGFILDLFQRNTLERLIISHCTDFDDDALELLMQGEDPEIDPLTTRAVVPPRKLRHFDFSRCNALTDKGAKAIAYNTPDLVGLQASNCSSLTDSALSGILESTPFLTHLDLEELDELSNATLKNLANAPCAPLLEHLSVSYCEDLGDAGMLPVIRNCSNLKSIYMDNTKISDLVLTEVAAQIRNRNRKATAGNPSGRPRVGLRLVAFDCQNVNWTGVREVLSRNAEFYRRPHESIAPHYPCEIVSLKCFYGYQPTVDEHTKRVLGGDLARASMLERKWAEFMIATEEAGAQGAGARRRRRRAREAAMVHADEEEGGVRGGRRRARSGGCAVM